MRPEDKELRIGRLLADAYSFVFGQFMGLLKLALVPGLLMLGVLVAMFVLADLAAAAGMSEAVVGGLTVIGIVVALIVMIPFIAAWYRASLFGPAREQLVVSFEFGYREWRFFGYLFAIALIGSLVVFVPLWILKASDLGALSAPISSAAVFMLIWAMLYVVARLAFVLPASAAGIETSYGTAWRQSSGHGMRLAATIFIAELPWRVADTLVNTIAGGQSVFFYVPATAFISVISVAVLASTLSIAYRIVVQGEAGPPQTLHHNPRRAFT